LLQIVEHPDEEPRPEMPLEEEEFDVNKLRKERTDLLDKVSMD